METANLAFKQEAPFALRVRMWLIRPDRTCQLGYPYGTGLIGWALPLEKSWSFPAENPNLIIRRLLGHDRGEDAENTSKFHLENVTDSCAIGACQRKLLFTCG